MLSRLVLIDFRNHADLTVIPGAGFVVLTGENGAGKTNILEAVSLLAPGRGLRRAPLGEMTRAGGPGGFGVAGTLSPFGVRAGVRAGVRDGVRLSESDGTIEIATGTLASAPERRVVRIQGVAATANTLAEWATILWLTPAMDRLFVEPAGERRRFLDRLTLALVPRHAHHTTRYDAAMRARNRLLADEALPDPSWLTALETQMAEHGAAIDTARHETVALLAARLTGQPDGAFARAGLALEGWAGGALQDDLRRSRARDAAAGRTLAGPHRVDLIVTHLEKARAAALASTGEQKALLLGIVLAHADLVADRTERTPILLLDEVAAHLDPLRRAALFDRLAGRGQVWMTGTEDALFAGLDGKATRIAVGRLA